MYASTDVTIVLDNGLAYSAPNHCLNQLWLIIIRALKTQFNEISKIQSKIFIKNIDVQMSSTKRWSICSSIIAWSDRMGNML